jgi:hypothetical protein
MAAEKLSSRPCRRQRVLATTSNYPLGTSSYTKVRCTVQHVVKYDKEVNESQTHADPDKYNDDAKATED